MKKLVILSLIFFTSFIVSGQSIDAPFSRDKMRKDLEVFKEIRVEVNSGLYKYRTKKQIDSIYNWADNEINSLSTYGDFYNLISTLTDYEGSLHNDTSIPDEKWQSLREEEYGYFPFPIKWVDGKWLINFENKDIPLGAEIVSINTIPIAEIILNTYKYYTTDGLNITGKRIGIRTHFARYYRLHYGLEKSFTIAYKGHNANTVENVNIESISSIEYYKRFKNRHSKPYDQNYYEELGDDEKYTYKKIDSHTGILTINSFSMGSENSAQHKNYVTFLDDVFTKIEDDKLQNLIIDVRQNGGGTDPNDLVTYSYLADRDFQENIKAWISFDKIPLLKHYNTKVPQLIRPLGIGKYNKELQEIFPVEDDHHYFQNENSNDHKRWVPHQKAFKGTVYLLISPAIASAGSLFAAMLAGNKNVITIGEETMGGYYGHNGHTPLEYKLPKSKIVTGFSIVNLEQDVPKKSNQIQGRGIIPDYEISQTFDDFMEHKDTQLNTTLKLIEANKK